MSLLNSGGSLPPADLDLDKGKQSPLLAGFKGFIRREDLFRKNASILIAVSGGPDSVCLLNLLFLLSSPWSLRLAVAHFDHCLRGEESRRDCGFVQDLCRRNSIPFFSNRADIGAIAREKKLGVQETARKIRYAFFRDTARREKLQFTATGHTCDDQAEEIIFRLTRGSGPDGLSGINVRRRDGIIRPLLFSRKKEILEHLRRYEIPFVADSSNLQTKYTRNRIRKLIMPLLEKEVNPAAVRAIYRAGRLLAEENQALESIAESAYGRCSAANMKIPGIAFSRNLLLQVPKAVRKRIYKRAMVETGVPPRYLKSDHMEKADEIIVSENPSSVYSLPEKRMLLKNYDRIYFLRETVDYRDTKGSCDMEFSQTVYEPGLLKLPAGSGELLLVETGCSEMESRESGSFFPRPLWICLDEVDFPFQVTFRKRGDRFDAYGLNKDVKLKKFLINRHIPRTIRDFLPILRKDNKIIAVCGIEITEKAKIRASSRRCLRILWKPEHWITGP